MALMRTTIVGWRAGAIGGGWKPRGGAVSSCGARTTGSAGRRRAGGYRARVNLSSSRSLALTASANAMDARASSSTSCRCAANADAMRTSTYSFHADTLRVQHRVQRGGAQRVRRHASAGGFFAGPNPRSQKAATMSSSSASIVCWLRSSSPRAGFALRMAASRRRVWARTRNVLTPAFRRARERRARAASGDGERCSITAMSAVAA